MGLLKLYTTTTIALVFVTTWLKNVKGFPSESWTNAHATFYGGGDASGTMGNLMNSSYSYN